MLRLNTFDNLSSVNSLLPTLQIIFSLSSLAETIRFFWLSFLKEILSPSLEKNSITFFALKSGKVDVSGCSIIVTEERKKSVLFSEPDYTGGIVVVTRR